MSSCASLAWPSRAAKWRGVMPSRLRELTSAPTARSSSAISSTPHCAQRIGGRFVSVERGASCRWSRTTRARMSAQATRMGDSYGRR
eukprot:8327715-Pyramimonas_sp.AAC.1